MEKRNAVQERMDTRDRAKDEAGRRHQMGSRLSIAPISPDF